MKCHTTSKFFTFIATLFVISSCSTGSSEKADNISKPYQFESANPISEGLAIDSLQKVDELLERAVAEKWVSGVAVLVARNGKIVFDKAYGYRDLDKGDFMETKSIFRIASMTKPITSLAILQLEEAGKLNFNDPVSKYIPEFANPQVLESINPKDSSYTSRQANTEITIHHLLTHTSGISYGFADTLMNKIYAKHAIIDLTTLKPVKLEENISKLAQLPLKHDPGSAWTYGLSIDVLGRVVEVASGMEFDAYLRKNIFEPLGMNDTYFYQPEKHAGRLSKMYQNSRENPLVPFPHRPEINMSGDFPIEGAKTYFSGGGGLSSTTHDYLRFCQAILNGGYLGENRIISENSLAKAKENMTAELRVGRDRFSYGFMVTQADGDLRFGRKPGRLSWGGAFQTTFWIDQERELIAILMTQVYPSFHQSKIYEGFEKAVNSAVFPIQ
jgi:CubicO group peptidase (beta-lactamase class C family)